MKSVTLRASALVLMVAILAGCSAKCNCPVCPAPMQQQPQTTIIHEPQ